MEATLHKKKRMEIKQQNQPLKENQDLTKKKGGGWKRKEMASPQQRKKLPWKPNLKNKNKPKHQKKLGLKQKLGGEGRN